MPSNSAAQRKTAVHPENEHRSFPAPELLPAKGDSKSQEPRCLDVSKYATGRFLSESDLEDAISAWCVDGAKIPGYGPYGVNGPQYPPEGESGFYPDDRAPMHIHLGVQTVDNGAGEPYEDMRWCE